MIVTGGGRTGGITTRTYTDAGVAGWAADHGDTVQCVAADAAKNVYTGGAVASSITTRKYDNSGALQWSVNHGARVYGIAVDASGNVYTCGAASGGYTTRKYNSAGTLQWSVDHGNTVTCIAVDSSGNVYTGGNVSGDGYTTRKYNSSGSLQWSANHGSAVYGIAVNSTTVITGGFYNSAPTVRYYALDGTPGFTGSWGGNTVNAVFTNATGNVWIAGNSGGGSGDDRRYARALDSSGTVTLSINLNTVTGTCVTADADGNIYTGQIRASSITTRKYNSSGTLQWSKDHGDGVSGIAWVAEPADQATAIPGLPIPISLGSVAITQFHAIPALAIPLSLAIPGSSAPPLPPEWADIPVARIYRAAVSAPGGSDLLAVPIASFQCVRRLGASTWLTVVTPGFTPTWLAALQARIGGELVINAGTRDSAGVETLGLFLRATLTAVEYTQETVSAPITLTARVINPSYSSTSRTLTGIRHRSKATGRWTLICDADPLLRPNDTAVAGVISLTVGSIRHSISANDASMEVVEVAADG